MVSCNNEIHKIQYYPTGEKQFEYHTIDGITQGALKEYYKDGKLESEVNMKDGKKNGIYKAYYGDGHTQVVAKFINDRQVDTMKVYYDNGKIREISYYTDGDKTGPYKEFYSNGNIKMEGNLIKGNVMGIAPYYDSVTGLLSGVIVCDTAGGEHHSNADTSDFKLSRIATKDSQLFISIPHKWWVKYNWEVNYKGNVVNMELVAAKPLKNVDTSKYKIVWKNNEVNYGDTAQTMMIILANKYSAKTAHKNTVYEVMSASTDDSKKSGETIKASDIGVVVIGGDTAAICRRLTQKNGVQCALSEMLIRHDNTFYHIMCKTSPAKYPYYVNLFDEIMKGINFSKTKTNL